jgi:hypothetical protein
MFSKLPDNSTHFVGNVPDPSCGNSLALPIFTSLHFLKSAPW